MLQIIYNYRFLSKNIIRLIIPIRAGRHVTRLTNTRNGTAQNVINGIRVYAPCVNETEGKRHPWLDILFHPRSFRRVNNNSGGGNSIYILFRNIFEL